MAVEERIKSIIAEQLGVKPDEVTPEASFIDDLGADSLDTVELIMALEEEFGVEIPDEDAEKMTCVGDAIKYINENAHVNMKVMMSTPQTYVDAIKKQNATYVTYYNDMFPYSDEKNDYWSGIYTSSKTHF